MNVAVVGSRDWTDRATIMRALNELVLAVGVPKHELTIISGGARGVDSIAAEWARRARVRVIEHLPDWNRFGKSAGFKRNVLIVEDADLVLAFQHNSSKGTQHSIDLARQRGIPVIVWTT